MKEFYMKVYFLMVYLLRKKRKLHVILKKRNTQNCEIVLNVEKEKYTKLTNRYPRRRFA